MYYLLLLIPALMWSLVGVMVKSASAMFDSGVITFCRFLFGAVFLGILLLLKDKKIVFHWKYKWIWFGMIGKSCNYIFENLAISMGFAYASIIEMPTQAIFLTFVAIFFFNEEIYTRKIIAIILCVIGVMMVSLKGASIKEFLHTNLLITILFLLSSIGSGIHLISQKKLIQRLDNGNMNFSVFLLCTAFTAVPIPFTFRYTGHASFWAIYSLLGLGIITGASFYIYSEVLKKVPFLITAIVSNSSVLFMLLWAWLFFKEPINKSVIIGAIILISGLILLNIPRGKYSFIQIIRSVVMYKGE